jgi:hypothetical protein
VQTDMSFNARFDRGEIEWNGDDAVLAPQGIARTRIVLAEALAETLAQLDGAA